MMKGISSSNHRSSKTLEALSKSSLNAQARWFVAWSYVQLEEDEAATKSLGDFVGRHSSDRLAATATFWLGKN